MKFCNRKACPEQTDDSIRMVMTLQDDEKRQYEMEVYLCSEHFKDIIRK